MAILKEELISRIDDISQDVIIYRIGHGTARVVKAKGGLSIL